MSSIKIRKLQKKDIFNGFLLSLDSLRKSSQIKPNKANAIFDKIAKNSHHVIYVAVDNSEIIGSASILIEQKFIHGGGKVGHIEDVTVRKEFQGKGVGNQIVVALLKYAQKQGCYKTILDCTDELIPFYKKMGFKRHSNSMRFDHLSKK
ncbi:MAG: GNAT family N-acetyltransferase [Thaumarchaeota archaeon]|nr:GNAT family N-acetyltransferase [Nitrososphaerota archaeon]MDE1841685.1 GNAT family N-acetyltransferase [Nitrososphaerota archaeon]MDE1877843.1 GNAT family N-acetyltransferase [Nitrososphaerota archaeon]